MQIYTYYHQPVYTCTPGIFLLRDEVLQIRPGLSRAWRGPSKKTILDALKQKPPACHAS